MFSFKIVAILFLAGYSPIECSVPHAHAVPAVTAVRYALVAPQNVRPFAAQVSTFTKGLNVYDAPYAAGVLSGPAIVPRAVAPTYSGFATAPAAPLYPGFPPAPVAPVYPAVASAGLAPGYPTLYPAPIAPGVAPAAPIYPAPVAPLYPSPVVAPAPAYPSHLLPAPFARSIHAVAPGHHPAIHSAPLYR